MKNQNGKIWANFDEYVYAQKRHLYLRRKIRKGGQETKRAAAKMQGAEQGMRIRAMKEEGGMRDEKCTEEWEKSKRERKGGRDGTTEELRKMEKHRKSRREQRRMRRKTWEPGRKLAAYGEEERQTRKEDSDAVLPAKKETVEIDETEETEGIEKTDEIAKPLHLAIDLTWCRPGEIGGIESSVRNLLSGMQELSKEAAPDQVLLLVTKANRDTFAALAKDPRFQLLTVPGQYQSPGRRLLSLNLHRREIRRALQRTIGAAVPADRTRDDPTEDAPTEEAGTGRDAMAGRGAMVERRGIWEKGKQIAIRPVPGRSVIWNQSDGNTDKGDSGNEIRDWESDHDRGKILQIPKIPKIPKIPMIRATQKSTAGALRRGKQDLDPGLIGTLGRHPGQGWKADQKGNPMVLLEPCGYHAFLLPCPGIRFVTVIHDLQPLDLPENFSLPRRLGKRLLLANTFRHADGIIAVSDFTKKRILHYAPCTRRRLTRIYDPIAAGEDRGDIGFDVGTNPQGEKEREDEEEKESEEKKEEKEKEKGEEEEKGEIKDEKKIEKEKEKKKKEKEGQKDEKGEEKDVWILSRYGLEPGQYYFTVSSLLPHKNLETLIRAFALLRDRKASCPGGRQWNLPCRLVIAGIPQDPTQKNRRALLKMIEEEKLTASITLSGKISDRQRDCLYRHCRAFLFPSLYEGFGMPCAEARLQGATVIASLCTAIPEAAGEKAVYVTSPKDPEAFLAAMEMAEDIRNRSWDTGRETVPATEQKGPGDSTTEDAHREPVDLNAMSDHREPGNWTAKNEHQIDAKPQQRQDPDSLLPCNPFASRKIAAEYLAFLREAAASRQ